MKRLFDFAVAAVSLILLLPLFLLVAVLIKMDSPGPVFFRQARIGLGGRTFRIFKFRSMVVGAYRMGSRLTTKQDPRVTRLGQILRWFKIDELPQLINVLIGEMSLIGPRPEDPYFVQFYTPEQRIVLSVRPGMVGPSQILGRDELESYPEGLEDTEGYYVEHILPEKLERDMEYVRHATFLDDLRLLMMGIWATLRGAIKTKYLWRRRKRIALMLVDLLLIAVAFWTAVFIRYEGRFYPHFTIPPFLIILLVRPVSLLYYGAYQGIPAYFGLWDIVALVKALTASAIVCGGLTFFLGFQKFPRWIFALDWALLLFMLGSLRYALRGWARHSVRRLRPRRKKAIIVGAGVSGEQIARTLIEDPLSPYRPVAFIDEIPERWGALIHGVRVVGGRAELSLTLSANSIQAVFVCMSDLSDDAAREIVEVCQREGADYRIVPALTDLLDAQTFDRPVAVRSVV